MLHGTIVDYYVKSVDFARFVAGPWDIYRIAA
jgi:hypothetical protein